MLLASGGARASAMRGRGDFAMDEDGRLVAARRAPDGAVCIHRRLDRASAHVRRRAAGPFSINQLWDTAIDNGALFGIRLDGLWMHVGTPEALERGGKVDRE